MNNRKVTLIGAVLRITGYHWVAQYDGGARIMSANHWETRAEATQAAREHYGADPKLIGEAEAEYCFGGLSDPERVHIYECDLMSAEQALEEMRKIMLGK